MSETAGARPRVALVTGASRGIGLAIARQLAGRGLTTVVAARDPAAAATVARALPDGRGIPMALDVTDPASVDRCAAACRERVGGVDVLVNNAGVLLDDGLTVVQVDDRALEATLAVNVVGVWRMIRALVPPMVARGYGRVVTLTSGMGRFTALELGSPAYSVSKTAVNMLTAQLAAELRGTGVLVNCTDPGWVRTDMGGPTAPRSLDQGADTAVHLATLPDDGPTGLLFREREPVDW